MANPSARATPNPLTRIRLVLSPGAARRGRVGWSAVVVAALAAGAAAGHFLWNDGLPAALPDSGVALQQLRTLQQTLEQTRLQLRASDARSHELERQIDSFNERLRACQEELTFFRNARDHANKR
jgi:septal ring factor EnvC (AmiA/AmiB activator)